MHNYRNLQAKIPCSHLCKCVDCKNKPEMDPDSQSLMQLADAAGMHDVVSLTPCNMLCQSEVRTQQQQQAAVHLLEHFEGPHGRVGGRIKAGRRSALCCVCKMYATYISSLRCRWSIHLQL